MKTIIRTTLVLITSMLACSAYAGDITGRVTHKGTPPPERTVDLKLDAGLAAMHPGGLTTRHYQVSADGGLRSVLVYLREDFADRKFEPPRTSPVLDHVAGLFEPYVMGIQVGQPLRLRCTDKSICSFHAMPRQNQEFKNQGFTLCPMSETVSRTFTASEVAVRFKCDLHPWNSAYVGVFTHPFFAVSGEDGRFSISNVPPGRYALEIFHPKTGKSAKEIVVSNGKSVMDFSVMAK